MAVKRTNIALTPLAGGLNLQLDNDLIGPTDGIPVVEFSHLLNFSTAERGRLKARKGSTKVLSEKITTNALTSIFPYEFHTGSEWKRGVVVSDGATVWTVSNATKSAIKASQTAASTWRGVVYGGKLYLSNGLNPPLVWDGTNVWELGIHKPTFTQTVDVSSGTGMTATTGYSYRFTYYDSTRAVESMYGASTLSTGAFTNKAITLGGFTASSQARVDKIRIYRTIDGGTTYYYVNQINDTTKTYNDTTSDATLIANAVLDVDDHDPPPAGTILEVWQGRLFMAGTATGTGSLGSYSKCSRGYVYYSNANEPEYWNNVYTQPAAGNRFSVEAGTGDVMGLRAFIDFLCVFTRDRIHRLNGEGSQNFYLSQVSTEVGLRADQCITSIGPSVHFFGGDPVGVYEFNGALVPNLTMAKMHRAFNPGPNETAYFEDSRWAYASIAYHKAANQVWVALTLDGNSTNDRILVLQLGVDARWTLYDHAAVALAYGSGVEDSTDLSSLYGIDRFGFLWRYDSGTADGVPSGTASGTATAGASTTLTDSGAEFYTTGDGLAGVKVRITGGTGVGQTRRISSNTGTVLTVETAWETTPDTTSTYRIGGIDLELETKALDFGAPHQTKAFRAVALELR